MKTKLSSMREDVPIREDTDQEKDMLEQIKHEQELVANLKRRMADFERYLQRLMNRDVNLYLVAQENRSLVEISFLRQGFNTDDELRHLLISHIRLRIDEQPFPRDWRLHHYLHQVLRLRGLSWLGLLDVDPFQYLYKIYDDDLDNDELRDSLIEIVCEQIDKGGPTIGLEIEKMQEYGELAKRIGRVLELRKEEIERVAIYAGRYVIRSLALTAYGFIVIRALEIGGQESIDTKLVVDTFAELGFTPKVKRDWHDVPNLVEISDGLKEYIWWLLSKRKLT